MGIFDAGELFGAEKSTQTSTADWRKAPEYAEAEGARGMWWDTLQDWGSQTGYGAIQPNWDDIWNQAKNRVSTYYKGGIDSPGAYNIARSDAARRGMSDSPAVGRSIARLSMQEGQQLQDIALEQAMKEAMLGEQGRQLWLQSLQGLSSLKPQMINYGSTTTGTTSGGEGWELLGAAGQAAMASAGMPGMPTGGYYPSSGSINPSQYSGISGFTPQGVYAPNIRGAA